MTSYAQSSEVPVERSRIEIERTLIRYGAEQFISGWEEGRAIIAFSMQGRRVRLVLALPPVADRRFRETPRGRSRTEKQAFAEWEKETRRLWRALALIVKAKLEAIEIGITTFEEEFLSSMLLPDGSTVGQRIIPDLIQIQTGGNMPPLLPR